jgi:hypothetical protein
MTTRPLLRVTAVVEAATGVALVVAPSAMSDLLFGEGLSAPQALVVGRIPGVALVSVVLACWLTASEHGSGSQEMIAGMVVYNIGVSILLIYAAVGLTLLGLALWPAVVLHAGLAAWCLACLRSGRAGAK